MAISVCEVSITQSPLGLPSLTNSAAVGARVDFWGMVRGLEGEKEIIGIDYEANVPMAEHQMRGIAENSAGRFGLTRVVIIHRIGFVPVAEASIVVRVESGHRLAAFNANQWIMDEVKRTVPIWKHPVFKESDPAGAASARNQGTSDSPTARA